MSFLEPSGTAEDVVRDAAVLSLDVHRNGKQLGTIFTADELQRAVFDPQRYAVPGVIPEGATLLCGSPKIGKSRLALGVGLSVASGGVALSHTEVAKGGVLYLSLEDGKRRLQERISALLGDEGAVFPPLLTIATEWPRLDQGGLEQLEAYLTDNPTRLVIVDVLQTVRAPSKSRASGYEDDYGAIRDLKAVADRHNVALLILHHTRKMDANDPLDLVSGTNGLAGAVDAVLILQREPHGGDVTLYLRGRDVEESQYTLTYARETGAWAIQGEARAKPLARTREEVMCVLEAARPDPVAPKDIAAALGIEPNTCYQRLLQMEQAELIRRVGRGLYTTVETPASFYTPTKEAKERDTKGPILSILSTPLERESPSVRDGASPEPADLSILSTPPQTRPVEPPADCTGGSVCQSLGLCDRAKAGQPCAVPVVGTAPTLCGDDRCQQRGSCANVPFGRPCKLVPR